MSYFIRFGPSPDRLMLEGGIYTITAGTDELVVELDESDVGNFATISDLDSDTVSRWDGAAVENVPRGNYADLLEADRSTYRSKVNQHRDRRLQISVTFEWPAASGQLFYTSQDTRNKISSLTNAMNPTALNLLGAYQVRVDEGTNAGTEVPISDFSDLQSFAAAYLAAYDNEKTRVGGYDDTIAAINAETTRSGMASVSQAYLDS